MAKAERIVFTQPGVRLDLTKEEAIDLFDTLDNLDFEYEMDTLVEIMKALGKAYPIVERGEK